MSLTTSLDEEAAEEESVTLSPIDPNISELAPELLGEIPPPPAPAAKDRELELVLLSSSLSSARAWTWRKEEIVILAHEKKIIF